MNNLIRYAVELRASVEGDTLVGHAAVFDQIAPIGSRGYERVARTAFDGALQDVRALINHDENLLLGRQASGTLRVEVDDQGLAFEVELPDTQYARDLRTLVARGDLTGASFGFIPGKESWSRASDGRALRTHDSIKEVMDVSVATFPAYEGAGVRLRALTIAPLDRRTQLIRARAPKGE